MERSELTACPFMNLKSLRRWWFVPPAFFLAICVDGSIRRGALLETLTFAVFTAILVAWGLAAHKWVADVSVRWLLILARTAVFFAGLFLISVFAGLCVKFAASGIGPLFVRDLVFQAFGLTCALGFPFLLIQWLAFRKPGSHAES